MQNIKTGETNPSPEEIGFQKKLSIGEASEYLGVSIDTLRRWEKKGKIEPMRSPGGHRYFNKKDLDNLFGRKYERAAETRPRQRSEENILDKESPKDTPESPDLTNPETEIISDIPPEFLRPPRKVDIPQTIPIRVIKETYFQAESLEVKQSIEVAKIGEISVLTPPQEIQTPPLPNQQINKNLSYDKKPSKKS